MLSAGRKLGLLLLLLTPVPTLVAGLKISSLLADEQTMERQALMELLSGPLGGQDLLVMSDDHSQRLLDMGQIMMVAGVSLTPVFLATQHSLLHTARPSSHTKGSLLTALIIFHRDPTAFLLLLANNKEWNPGYLVLFCLNPHLDTTSVLAQAVIQRSQFILLLQPQHWGSHHRLFAYTSLPQNTKAPLGTWNINRFHTRCSLFPRRFKDFGGMILTVPVWCDDNPFLYLDKNGVCGGGNWDALKLIGDKQNFTFEINAVYAWGVKENGTWNGMFGELMYNDANIAISSFRLNADRFQDFDFPYPYWRYGFAVLLRVPQPTPRWKNIMYPFSPVMWMLIIATTVFVASSLSLLLFYIHNVTDPINIALKVVSGLLGQAMNDSRVRVFSWARVWLIFWWVAVDILAAAYMSNLMSVLTVPVYPHRIQTLQELAESDIIPVMNDYGGFVGIALNDSTNPVYNKLGHKLYLHPITNIAAPHAYPIALLKKGTHAFIDSIDYVFYLQHHYNLMCTGYIMREQLYKDYMSWFLPRNTPYTYVISDRLQRIVETGILRHIYDAHKADQIDTTDKTTGGGAFSLEHLQGAFIALGLGVVLATINALMECLLGPHFHHQTTTTQLPNPPAYTTTV